ncbi:hypothetical protein FT663_05328 [Candidozyma haemuli var. vulneris]|uniref:Enoyl reductase (ER) domain-containing protein n=1 Tax=Candidozyma haemuli TaxID=45357 RepID=A0A2V1AMB5_9ASCO|nr:hypothetical protein CXQ85_001333 [[Candida] haemuloni]KAF3985365.1 hypothetical protein FT663_05328 [[Candida] haemuloni var. vulneris]KAF3986571.1 hypothetical protein FT662_04475 [[Candida] haemuloni var. vulneris]PVH19039.1 hypothetical protein CXQ85_001333 [[Candida] haemuloni]
MVKLSAAAFIETNPDVSKALFNATATIDESKLEKNEILITALALPINPSDIFQVQGSYKTPILKQKLGNDPDEAEVAVGGNEGLFRITAVGSQDLGYAVGDWVILKLTSFGTWRSHAIVRVTEDNKDPLIVVSGDSGKISIDDASTISTNPSTAYQLINNYIKDWNAGEWIITNAGNSFVSKYLFQLARYYKLNTLAIIRKKSEEHFKDTANELLSLGATKVISDKEFEESSFVTEKLPQIVGNDPIRLALDSLGGPTTPNLVASLSPDNYFVNYGGLAGGFVSFDPRVQLAKNVTLKSYWLTRNTRNNPQSKVETVKALIKLFEEGVFGPVKYNKVPFKAGDNLRDIFVQAIQNSSTGKQVVTFEEHFP